MPTAIDVMVVVTMLKQRIITAVVLALLIGGGLLTLPVMGWALLVGALVIIGAWEWSALAGFSGPLARGLYSLACMAMLLGVSWYCNLFSAQLGTDTSRDVLGVAVIWWCFTLLWVKYYPASAALWGASWMRALMGFVTLVPAWMAVVFLRLQDQGIGLILILIALVASADIGAYFSGTAWGKAKLAPAVSPGKSWAGFWGGLVCCLLLMTGLWFAGALKDLSLTAALAIAVVTGLASVLGDLLESMVKRQQGVKDSGTILPGHGGVMDRLDSLTAAAPVFALCISLSAW